MANERLYGDYEHICIRTDHTARAPELGAIALNSKCCSSVEQHHYCKQQSEGVAKQEAMTLSKLET